jgi:hypothetical protein
MCINNIIRIYLTVHVLDIINVELPNEEDDVEKNDENDEDEVEDE